MAQRVGCPKGFVLFQILTGVLLFMAWFIDEYAVTDECEVIQFHGNARKIDAMYGTLWIRPAFQDAKLSPSNVMCMIGLGWLNALFWSAMPLLGWCRYSLERSGTSCVLDWQIIDEEYISYVTGLTTFSFVFPFFLLVICLLRASSASDTEIADKVSPRNDVEDWFTDKQLLKLTWTITITALIGWSPYAYTVMWAVFNDATTITTVMAVLPPLMAKASTMVYPFAYMAHSSHFRKAMFLALRFGKD